MSEGLFRLWQKKLSPRTPIVLKAMAEQPEQWYRIGDIPELKGASKHLLLARLAEIGLLIQDNFGTAGLRPSFRYQISQVGLDYLAFLDSPKEEPKPGKEKNLIDQDFPYAKVSEEKIGWLRQMAQNPDYWHSSAVLKHRYSGYQIYRQLGFLVDRGLLDRCVWGSQNRNTYRYRISTLGLCYLKYLDEQGG